MVTHSVDSMKRQKDMTLKDELPRLEGIQYGLRKSRGQLLTAPVRMKWLGQNGNNAQLWICLAVKVKFSAVKNNIT